MERENETHTAAGGAGRKRVVVVTGASGGVGRATARAFADQGADIALLARGQAGLAGALAEVEARGARAVAIPLDMADADAVERAATRIESELGPIDVWVNAAFSTVFARFCETGADEYRRATEVTYLGFVFGTMSALRRMRPRNHGTIVQVGSALAYRGIPLQAAYCGAKHAIQGFTESLRCELIHDRSGIRVTMVQLPAVNTTQFAWALSRLPQQPQPVPPIYQPEVAAKAIVYASSHPGRREHWVGRSTVMTLLANAVAPGALDRYLARTGFEAQQAADPRDPEQPHNLWEPVDAAQDCGSHGPFDERSLTRSAQLWASQHHGIIGALLGAGLVAGAGVAAAARRGTS